MVAGARLSCDETVLPPTDASDETVLVKNLALALGMWHCQSCERYKAKACWQTATPTSTSKTLKTMWISKAESMWIGKQIGGLR